MNDTDEAIVQFLQDRVPASIRIWWSEEHASLMVEQRIAAVKFVTAVGLDEMNKAVVSLLAKAIERGQAAIDEATGVRDTYGDRARGNSP